ncbi:hypothetical protein [Paraburkholderia sediminicola]|uniref:hypothetical protein n=1 Tax=Paraburkholderia sediminicola TaxID=458836 RepID=UPI0038B97A3D
MSTVKTEDLERFATSEQGPTLLGELIRRLVHCWTPNRLLTMGFHSGTANNLPDWDGHVQLKATHDEPAFNSLWELSTQNATRAKILGDVKKSFQRTVPAGWDASTTCFVAVTLRKLQNVGALEREIANFPKNPWGFVRIIDAPALVQWIEKCPAVEAWCAEDLGIGTGGFGLSLDRFWANWSNKHRPPISPQLVTAGRSSAEMDTLFKPTKGQTLTLLTDSADETAAYLHAHLKQSADQDGAATVFANALVVSDLNAARKLALQPVAQHQIPVTILLPPANEAAFVLANAGHYVFNALGYAAPSNQPKVIRRALRREFADALSASMGLPPEQAEQAARACGASVSVWSVWNRHEGNALAELPAWCADQHLEQTLPAVLATGWDEMAPSDKTVLETLSGISYDTFLRAITPHMRSDPPFLERAASALAVVAPTVAFVLTATRISQGFLRAFDAAIKEVFLQKGEASRASDGSSRGWSTQWSSSGHSTFLRDGLLETLLRISAFSEILDEKHVAYEFHGCQNFVNKIVNDLTSFNFDDDRFFTALSSNLPVLAEAAPIPFVNALERAVQGDAPSFARLFEDRGLFAPERLSGLLGALECLAWDPLLFRQSVMLLGHLAHIGSSTGAASRPLDSLRAIFLAWNPATSATLEQRIESLHMLNERWPGLAWQLIQALLPKPYDTSFTTREPIWKDFGRSARSEPTAEARSEAFVAYIEFAFELAGEDPGRQADLIDDYPLFPKAHRTRLLELLTRSAERPTLSATAKEEMRSKIRQLVAKHRRFANAVWAMPPQEVDELEQTGDLFKSTSQVDEVRWLFDDYLPDIPEMEADFQAASARADVLRSEAIAQLVGLGMQAIDELFVKARQSHLVAQHAGLSIVDDDAAVSLLDLWLQRNSHRDEMGVATLCAARFSRNGENWRNHLALAAQQRVWPDWALGLCVSAFPDSSDLLSWLAELPEASIARYWTARPPFLRDDDRVLNDRLAEGLVSHGRALELVNQSIQKLSPPKALDVLRSAAVHLAAPSAPLALLGYNVKESLEWLRAQDRLRQQEVAEIEFQFLPLLLGELQHGQQLTFHKTMAEVPRAFIETICAAYIPATPTEDTTQPKTSGEIEKKRASVAWRVLRTWTTPPGLTTANGVDFAALLDWINEARKLAAEADRAAVADQYIGAVLLHTPPGPDGTWPSEPVAKALEALSSDNIEKGVAMEVVNSRGATTRGVFDGGEIELGEHDKWLTWSTALPSRWQRAKRLCRSIATSWKQMAGQFSDEAAKRRLRS